MMEPEREISLSYPRHVTGNDTGYILAFAGWFWPALDAPGLRGGRTNKAQRALRARLQAEVDELYRPEPGARQSLRRA